jgi:hypothetical protein
MVGMAVETTVDSMEPMNMPSMMPPVMAMTRRRVRVAERGASEVATEDMRAPSDYWSGW